MKTLEELKSEFENKHSFALNLFVNPIVRINEDQQEIVIDLSDNGSVGSSLLDHVYVFCKENNLGYLFTKNFHIVIYIPKLK